MPLYEYRCQPCDQGFEALVRTPTDSPSCPSCGRTEVAKQFSVPAAAHVGGARGGSLPMAAPSHVGGGCGAPACGGGFCAGG